MTLKTFVNNLEKRISNLHVMRLILDTMTTKSLRVKGINSSGCVAEGEGSGEGRSEPAGVILLRCLLSSVYLK